LNKPNGVTHFAELREITSHCQAASSGLIFVPQGYALYLTDLMSCDITYHLLMRYLTSNGTLLNICLV